jgi:molybdopterin synthase sulfur carrier subunit
MEENIMACSVKIPTPLRRYTQGLATVEAYGSSVSEVLLDLKARFPELQERIFDGDGRVKSHLNIIVNNEDIRFLKGVNTPVSDKDIVTLLPALAGG